MSTESFPAETHPCLLHLEVHPLTPVCWRAAFAFQVGVTVARPDITDRELQDAYDEEFERKCLDFHARTHRYTDITGFADPYLAAAGLDRVPSLARHFTYPTVSEFLGAIA